MSPGARKLGSLVYSRMVANSILSVSIPASAPCEPGAIPATIFKWVILDAAGQGRSVFGAIRLRQRGWMRLKEWISAYASSPSVESEPSSSLFNPPSAQTASQGEDVSFTSGSASILGSVACGGAVAILSDSLSSNRTSQEPHNVEVKAKSKTRLVSLDSRMPLVPPIMYQVGGQTDRQRRDAKRRSNRGKPSAQLEED